MQTILNFLIKHNHWFLFLLLEGISLVLIISFNNYQGAVAFTSANGIAGNIYSAMSDINGYFGLKEENSALTAQNNSLMNEIDELKEELRSYRDSTLLSGNSFADKGNFSYSTARVVNNSLNKVNNYITIDKGSSHGIETEMGVFNEKGVVGIVYQTSDNFSIVIPLLNSKSRISCRVKGSESFCSLQWSGGDPQYSYLIDLPRYTVIEKGDTVVTSGYSSIFPAELPVGVIEEIEDSDDGLFYRAKTRLFTDFSTINNVYIVGNRNKDEQTALEKSIEKE
ncbi:MAG: rod shape-determining protein MreC [Bacteroidaceae bacterium]|mgnify:CR=1 FL=1|nr:rod shape-determining protein MreC [Bacteroidaceae bacterium]